MSASNSIWLLIALAVTALYCWFIFRGKTYGFRALAARSRELQSKGVDKVWLLYGNKGVGFATPLRFSSSWSLLNTGFLAYVSDNRLVIEAPWWTSMRMFTQLPLTPFSPAFSKVMYKRTTYAAIHIDHQSYTVRAVNIGDEASVKQALLFEDQVDSEALLTLFVSAIQDGRPHPKLSDNETYQTVPKPPKNTFWRTLRGTFLYILLPCIVITGAILLWAKLTNQPVFQ